MAPVAQVPVGSFEQPVGPWSRSFTAGVDLLYVVYPAQENPVFDVYLYDTSGTEPVELDHQQPSGTPNAAWTNNSGHLAVSSMNSTFEGASPTWFITNDGSLLTITDYIISEVVHPADYGNTIGSVWYYLDVLAISPDGTELVCGDTPYNGSLGRRQGRAWGIDSSTGAVNWDTTYELPVGLYYMGPCIGSVATGSLLAYYNDGAVGVTTAEVLLVDSTGIVDTLSAPGTKWELIRSDYWEALGSNAIAWSTHDGSNLRVRAVVNTSGALSWATDEIVIATPDWPGYGDDPNWSLARDAWTGQAVFMPGVDPDQTASAFWVDPLTGDYASTAATMTAAKYYLAVHATGTSTTIRSNVDLAITWGDTLDKWGPASPPTPSTRTRGYQMRQRQRFI